MDLERGVLARIDRKLLAGLGQNETYRMVRVRVTAPKWSTWKRYCESAGISMGRAIVTLIDRELVSVFGDHTGDYPPVLAEQADEELANREATVARREETVSVVEERLRGWNEHLRRGEAELETREQRAEVAAKISARPRAVPPKVGRNERCPCGSGLKYKHCHGLAGRRIQCLSPQGVTATLRRVRTRSFATAVGRVVARSTDRDVAAGCIRLAESLARLPAFAEMLRHHSSQSDGCGRPS